MVSQQGHSILVPNFDLLKLLHGTVVQFRNVLSEKPATKGQRVDLFLATEGAGMLGLADYRDSLEWAGINNNVWRTARVATYLAQLLSAAGVEVDIQLVFDAMLVFKLGRRRWDEATWYPSIITNAEDLQKKGDTAISLELLEKAGVPESMRQIVNFRNLSLGHPAEALGNTWESKICMYADFRTGQVVTTLQERFDDLSRRKRAPQEMLDYLSTWAFNAEEEIFSHLAITPDDITSDHPSMPYWEAILRQAYLQDAEESAYARLAQIQNSLWHGKLNQEAFDAILNKEFPLTSWWGQAMRRGSLSGTAGAIQLFEALRV